MRAGQPVVVTDDEDRENEGDLILAGELATAENIGFIVRYASGLICVGLPGDRCGALRLPPMVVNNEDPKCTAFTVSIDYKVGTTTGISAADRAATFRALANADASPDDFSRPGHVFPLRAVPGGVLEREGHTEASVDLCRLAGLKEVGVLCEIVNDDGSSAPPARPPAPPATPAADARARSTLSQWRACAAPALLQGARARAHVDRRHPGVHPGNAGNKRCVKIFSRAAGSRAAAACRQTKSTNGNQNARRPRLLASPPPPTRRRSRRRTRATRTIRATRARPTRRAAGARATASAPSVCLAVASTKVIGPWPLEPSPSPGPGVAVVGQPRWGTCAPTHWRGKTCERPAANPCSNHTSCVRCATNLNCGWCAGGGSELPSCRLGGAGGPSSGQCAFWQKGFCTDEDTKCVATLGCEACASRRGCGFNRRSGMCEAVAKAVGSDRLVQSYRACSSGSFEAQATRHAKAGWLHDGGPTVADPYALQPTTSVEGQRRARRDGGRLHAVGARRHARAADGRAARRAAGADALPPLDADGGHAGGVAEPLPAGAGDVPPRARAAGLKPDELAPASWAAAISAEDVALLGELKKAREAALYPHQKAEAHGPIGWLRNLE